jgi:hypothetical protein
MKFDPMKEIPNMFKLISYTLSIPRSNTFAESIFPMANNKWSENVRVFMNLIKYELQMTLTINQKCKDLYEHIKIITGY